MAMLLQCSIREHHGEKKITYDEYASILSALEGTAPEMMQHGDLQQVRADSAVTAIVGLRMCSI